jgi:hypothetical protein
MEASTRFEDVCACQNILDYVSALRRDEAASMLAIAYRDSPFELQYLG